MLPLIRMVEVLRLREGTWTIVVGCGESYTVRIEPFEAIERELGRLWIDSGSLPDPVRQRVE